MSGLRVFKFDVHDRPENWRATVAIQLPRSLLKWIAGSLNNQQAFQNKGCAYGSLDWSYRNM